MDEQNPEIQEDLGMGGKFKNWMQDNIRIIISVLIVVAIAGGIYSYSKRGEDVVTEEDLAVEEIEDNIEDESAVAVVGGDEESAEEVDNENGEEAVESVDVVTEEDGTEENSSQDIQTEETETVQDSALDQEGEQIQTEDVRVDTGITEGSSEETEEAFIEKASKGDSVTTLARKSLKDYLEKNQDSSLTAEQKIYIEDYLRKAVNHQGGVQVGTSISFSKNLIRDGIEKAKTLNEAQLNNLKKYSARVSNL